MGLEDRLEDALAEVERLGRQLAQKQERVRRAEKSRQEAEDARLRAEEAAEAVSARLAVLEAASGPLGAADGDLVAALVRERARTRRALAWARHWKNVHPAPEGRIEMLRGQLAAADHRLKAYGVHVVALRQERDMALDLATMRAAA